MHGMEGVRFCPCPLKLCQKLFSFWFGYGSEALFG